MRYLPCYCSAAEPSYSILVRVRAGSPVTKLPIDDDSSFSGAFGFSTDFQGNEVRDGSRATKLLRHKVPAGEEKRRVYEKKKMADEKEGLLPLYCFSVDDFIDNAMDGTCWWSCQGASKRAYERISIRQSIRGSAGVAMIGKRKDISCKDKAEQSAID